jgi:hypothetical protein
MSTRISVPLSEIDENFLKKLREEYPRNSRLDIQIVALDDIPNFSEEDFWQIIAQLNWSAESRDAVLSPAVSALAAHKASHIYLFEDLLAEKLYQLDTQLHAKAAYPNGHFSEDGFLYIRAAVVAAGKDHYRRVLNEPSEISGEEDFEPLLSLAALAYMQKTGLEFNYIPPTSYETYSNEAGWA